MAARLTYLIALQVLLVTLALASKNKTIYLLCLLPYPDPRYNPSWSEGPPISLALGMAQEQINNQTALLPDYHIQLIHDDSGCEFTTKAYVGFMRNVYSNSNKKVIGIIGPGCSSAALAIAPLTSNKDIAIVTLHGGGSPLLANRTNYGYAISSLGGNDSFALIGIKLMQKSGWSRVGVLFDESRLFYASTSEIFRKVLDNSDNLTIGFLSPVYDTFIPLDVIVNEGLRINFLFTPVVTTQRILCLAMHQGLVYPAYQWIITSNTFDEVARDVLFTYNNVQYSCSETDMKTVALNQCAFINYRLSPLNETAPTTYSKHSFREYDSLI